MGKRNKIIRAVIIICVVFFLAYQYYVALYASISTESASMTEYTDGVDAIGTFIRNEITVTNDQSGTLHFTLASGDKVAKGGTIAEIYSSDAASAAAARITEIEEQLSLIEEIEGYNDITAVDIDTINDRIYTYLNDLIYQTRSDKYLTAADGVTKLITMMTRKQVATGEQSDFSALKTELTAEKEQLTLQMGTPKGSVVSQNAGYFVSTTDGFESVFTVMDLESYTPEKLSDASKNEIANNVIGKIVYDYEWYMAVPVTIKQSLHYKVGDIITIKNDTVTCPRITGTVVNINLSEKGEDAVIIFRCSEMNSELASMRNATVKLITDEVSGIKVNSKAIRVKDGVTGVYVVSGLEAKFVKVEILYSEDEYKICKLNTGDSSQLRLYDRIIVKGKNLYDGKNIY